LNMGWTPGSRWTGRRRGTPTSPPPGV